MGLDLSRVGGTNSVGMSSSAPASKKKVDYFDFSDERENDFGSGFSGGYKVPVRSPVKPTVKKPEPNYNVGRISADDYFGAALDRFDPGWQQEDQPVMRAIENLALAPIRVHEMPVSTIDVAISKILSKQPVATKVGPLAERSAAGPAEHAGSPIDQIGKFINDTPILGDVARGIGGLLKTSGQVGSAGINAADIERLQRLKGQPDDRRLWDISPTLVNSLDMNMTVGDFRLEMLKRGVKPEDMQALDAGEKGLLDFGHLPSSSNPLFATAQSIAFDPTNILFAAGPVKAVATGVGLLGAGARYANVGLKTLTGAGVGTLPKLQKLGAVGMKAPSKVASAAGIHAGRADMATNAGLGHFIQKSLVMTDRAVKGYTKIALGETAAVVGLNAASDWLDDALPGDNILWEGARGLYDLSDAIINRHPLSENATLAFVSAMNFPVRSFVPGLKRNVRLATNQGKNIDGAIGAMAEAFIPDVRTSIGERVKITGNTAHNKRVNLFLGRMGSKEGAISMINYADALIAGKRVDHGTETMLNSIDANGQRAVVLREELDRLVTHMREEGMITNKMRVQAIREHLMEKGPAFPLGIRDFDPDLALHRWNNVMVPTILRVGETLAARGEAMIVANPILTKQNIQDIARFLEPQVKDGKISVKAVKQIAETYPNLLYGKGVTEGGNVYNRTGRLFRPEDAGSAVEASPLAYLWTPDAQAPSWDWLKGELDRAEKRAPDADDLASEMGGFEAGADESPTMPDPDQYREATGDFLRTDGMATPEPAPVATESIDLWVRAARQAGAEPGKRVLLSKIEQAWKELGGDPAQFAAWVTQHIDDFEEGASRKYSTNGKNPTYFSIKAREVAGPPRDVAASRGDVSVSPGRIEAAGPPSSSTAGIVSFRGLDSADTRLSAATAESPGNFNSTARNTLKSDLKDYDTTAVDAAWDNYVSLPRVGLTKEMKDAMDAAWEAWQKARRRMNDPQRAANDPAIIKLKQDYDALVDQVMADVSSNPNAVARLEAYDAYVQAIRDAPRKGGAAVPEAAPAKITPPPTAVESVNPLDAPMSKREDFETEISEVADKLASLQRPNVRSAQSAINRVQSYAENNGVDIDTSGLENALDEYTSIERSDYPGDPEGYAADREQAWESFLEEFENFDLDELDWVDELVDEAPVSATPTSEVSPARLDGDMWRELASDSRPKEAPGYIYHVTDDLESIRNEGLTPHEPSYRGEQTEWPDGEPAARSYFAKTPLGTRPFVLEEASTAMVRVKRDSRFQNERGTGDVITDQPIAASELEYLGADGAWHPVERATAGVIPEGDDLLPGGPVPARAESAGWREVEPEAAAPEPAALTDDDYLGASMVRPREIRSISPDALLGVGRKRAPKARTPSPEEMAPVRAVSDEKKGIDPVRAAEKDTEAVAATDDLVDWKGIKVSKDAFEEYERLSKSLRAWMPGFDIAPAPRLNYYMTPSDIVSPQFASQNLRAHGLAESLRYWGPFSGVGRLLDNVIGPQSSAEMRLNAKQAVMNLGGSRGMLPEEWDRLLGELVKDSARDAVFMRAASFGSPWESLKPARIESHAVEQINPAAYARIRKDFGSFSRMLDRSFNRGVQKAHGAATKGRAKGATRNEMVRGRLGEAIEGFYGGFQGTLIGRSGRYVKMWYPILRYASSPRYWAMNMAEGDMIGRIKYGSGMAHDQARLSTYVHRRGSTNGQRYTDEVSTVMNAADTGTPFVGRVMASWVDGAVLRESHVNIDSVINQLPTTSREHKALVDNFGPDPRSWADQINDMFYEFDTKGVKEAVEDAAAEIWTPEQIRELSPVLQRIWDLNQKSFNAAVHLFEGNNSRSNLERVMNSYWLYWPISYQLKASKWLIDIMTEKSFGRNTSFGGAYMVNRVVQDHKEKMATDKAYSQMFIDNELLWFTAQMIFPITPFDIGAGLSKATRYAAEYGTAAMGELGLWGKYQASRTPPAALLSLLNLGPFYDIRLLERLYNQSRDKPKEKPEPEIQRPLADPYFGQGGNVAA
jgi:hypothetical protein